MTAINKGDAMNLLNRGLVAAAAVMLFLASSANAQDSSIYVQCPETTDLHPTGDGIKCDHLAAGDGMVTMADDDAKKQYVFSFSRVPLPGEDGAPTVASGEYPSYVMEQGMLAANAPAPTIVLDEDDEFFLSLTNVGMAMRPDLFDPHTVHWHGFPQAASIFDGVPDSSVSVNMGATLTYYYNVQDAGTYMYHCHVEATEHMQMGMLGNLYVRPKQNKLGYGATPEAMDATVSRLGGNPESKFEGYAYNDGDGSTGYDVEYPIQIGSFDPDFHDASLNVQPLPFAGMRDRYFLLNGRGYPDTAIEAGPQTDGRDSQPVSSYIEATDGEQILLRISNLNVTQFNTLGTNGPPMKVIALDARLLRDDDGNDMYYETNSLTLGGGQSADVIIDTTNLGGRTYFLYSTNLDYLANDAENFGGMMTEIRISN
jgi:FtsP/CotA-like multicopper oxidase with cupredoxin domain